MHGTVLRYVLPDLRLLAGDGGSGNFTKLGWMPYYPQSGGFNTAGGNSAEGLSQHITSLPGASVELTFYGKVNLCTRIRSTELYSRHRCIYLRLGQLLVRRGGRLEYLHQHNYYGRSTVFSNFESGNTLCQSYGTSSAG